MSLAPCAGRRRSPRVSLGFEASRGWSQDHFRNSRRCTCLLSAPQDVRGEMTDFVDSTRRRKSKPKRVLDGPHRLEASCLVSVINSRDPTRDEVRVVISVLPKLVPTDGLPNRSDQRRLETSAVSDDSERTAIRRVSRSARLALLRTSRRPRPRPLDHRLLSTPSLFSRVEATSPRPLLPLRNDRSCSSSPEQNLSMEKRAKTRRRRRATMPRRTKTMVPLTPTPRR